MFHETFANATIATSNDSEPVSPSVLAALVHDAVSDSVKCRQIIEVVEKRLADKSARNWRQIYKALLLLDALVKTGSLAAIKYSQIHLASLLESLVYFYFDDDEEKNAASNIRHLSKKILTILEKPLQEPPKPSIPNDKHMDNKPNAQESSSKPQHSANSPSLVPPQNLPIRIWTDLSGSYKVEARFLSVSGNMVTLERPNGEQMGIMMDKMCSADLDYILSLRQQGIDVRKVSANNIQADTIASAGTSHLQPQQPTAKPQSIQKLNNAVTTVVTNAEKLPNNPDSPTSATTAAKTSLPPGFIIPSTALKIDLTPSGKLGAGTSGVVRKATYSNTAVAVKIISVRHLTKPQREAVIKEAEIMSRIVHPNAVRLFGVMIEEGLGLGLVMELLPRGCLKDFIETTLIPSLAQRIRFARDVSHAMAYLHDTLNMVHRDLKALNVLIDDSGVFLRAKVCDFGFAHVKSLGMESTFWNGATAAIDSNSVSAGSEFIGGGAIRGLKMQAAMSMGSMTVNGGMGTPVWMAPELFDMNALISKPADVYAFTIVMTEIFSWAGPYCIKYEAIIPIMQNVIRHVQSGNRPDLVLTPDVPASIRAIIEAGWDQNPDKRPTFREMTRVLEKAKAEADYNSIYASTVITTPLAPTAPLNTRDSRLEAFMNQQQQQQYQQVSQARGGSQPLDNMQNLQQSLPPQSSLASSSAPSLNVSSASGSPVANTQINYMYNNPFRDPSPSPAPLRNSSPGLTNSHGASLPMLSMQPQQFVNTSYPNSPTNQSSGQTVSMPLQQQNGQFRPVLTALPRSRPQSIPSSELMSPGTKHISLWDVKETGMWLMMLGENMETVRRCKELRVDGKMLLRFTEQDLSDKLGVDLTRSRRLWDLLDDYRVTMG